MNFKEWWMKLHPAEVDELKPVFEDCWKQAKREQMDKCIRRFARTQQHGRGTEMSAIVERLGNLNDAILACGNDYSDILLDAVNEIKQLRQRLEDCESVDISSHAKIVKLEEQLSEYKARENDILDVIQDALCIFNPEPGDEHMAPKWAKRAESAIKKV